MAMVRVDDLALPGLATLAGMHQYVGFLKAVGEQRRKHKVSPPEMDGPPEFIRTVRAASNTLEFYPLSLASLWVGSVFLHPVPMSLLYGGYLYGRGKYFKGYVKSAEDRIPGFALQKNFLMAMMILACIGVGHKVIRRWGGVNLWQILVARMGGPRMLMGC